MDVLTEIYHLQESPLYAQEKAYTMRYIPDDSIAPTNVHRHKQHVKVKDMRGTEHDYKLDQNGFTVAKVNSHMNYEDFQSHDKITDVYLNDLETVLKQIFPGSQIDFISYLIRRRDTQFPYATGQVYSHGQPNIVAHVDATPQDLVRQVSARYSTTSTSQDTPNKASSLLEKRCQYISIWKPLNGPLYDWPLALCDNRSINPKLDLEPQDIVDREQVFENFHVYHRPNHEWRYLSGQTEEELLVFRQADTKVDSIGTPHCAFENPMAPEGCCSRESIEVVAFVYGPE